MTDTNPSPTESKNGLTWRCFHCEEVFTDRALAAEHFGWSEHADVACRLNECEGGVVALLRQAHAELSAYRDEDTKLVREVYGLGSKHQTEKREANEKGYADGLRDGRTEVQPATPTAREQALEEAAKMADERVEECKLLGLGKPYIMGRHDASFGIANEIRALAKSSPPKGEEKPQQKGDVQWSTSLTTKIECAIGGAYEFPDARKFWIDGPVAREITRRVCAAITPAPQRQTVDDAAVERAAKAIRLEFSNVGPTWETLTQEISDRWLRYARAALLAAFPQEN